MRSDRSPTPSEREMALFRRPLGSGNSFKRSPVSLPKQNTQEDQLRVLSTIRQHTVWKDIARLVRVLWGIGTWWMSLKDRAGGAVTCYQTRLSNDFTHLVPSEYLLERVPANSRLWSGTTAFHCSKNMLFFLLFEHFWQNCTEFWAARVKHRVAPSLNNNVFFGCDAQKEPTGTHSAPFGKY